MTLLIFNSYLEVPSAALRILHVSSSVLLPLFPQCLGAAGWQIRDYCLGYGQGEGSGAGQRDPDLLQEQANVPSPHVCVYLPVHSWHPPASHSLLYKRCGSGAYRLIHHICGARLGVVTAGSRRLSSSQEG